MLLAIHLKRLRDFFHAQRKQIELFLHVRDILSIELDVRIRWEVQVEVRANLRKYLIAFVQQVKSLSFVFGHQTNIQNKRVTLHLFFLITSSLFPILFPTTDLLGSINIIIIITLILRVRSFLPPPSSSSCSSQPCMQINKEKNNNQTLKLIIF